MRGRVVLLGGGGCGVLLMSIVVSSLQAVSLPFLAAIGALIARQQANTARVKLQHDLFDRRFRTFSCVNVFIGKIVREADIGLQEIFSFHRDVSDAEFFFDDDVVAYINKVKRMAGVLHAVKKSHSPAQTEAQRLEVVAKVNDCEQWFLEQIDVVSGVFKKSMFIPTIKPLRSIMVQLLRLKY